jgi:hypothetical protein
MSNAAAENNAQEQGQDQAGSEDLQSALSGPETEFVAGEEKKPAMTQLLYLLLLLAVGGGGMYYMYKRQGPASASASTPEAAKAAETVKTFLSSGPDNIKAMQMMLKDTEKFVKQFNEYPSVKQTPLSALVTNPFRFAVKAANPDADAEAAKKKREDEKAQALKASESLILQSIIHSGSRKACMINNALYTEGQQVDQFIVEAIEAHRVIVKTGSFRFQLTMQK